MSDFVAIPKISNKIYYPKGLIVNNIKIKFNISTKQWDLCYKRRKRTFAKFTSKETLEEATKFAEDFNHDDFLLV